jgi:Flp pilus assembly protein protease CpaA
METFWSNLPSGLAFLCLCLAAWDDLKHMEIRPHWWKISFLLLIFAAVPFGWFRTYEVVYTGMFYFVFGLCLYYMNVLGGGDVKLLAPTGAFIAYEGISFLSAVFFFSYVTLIYTILVACVLFVEGKKIRGMVPYAPVFPLTILLAVLFFKGVGF